MFTIKPQPSATSLVYLLLTLWSQQRSEQTLNSILSSFRLFTESAQACAKLLQSWSWEGLDLAWNPWILKMQEGGKDSVLKWLSQVSLCRLRTGIAQDFWVQSFRLCQWCWILYSVITCPMTTGFSFLLSSAVAGCKGQVKMPWLP